MLDMFKRAKDSFTQGASKFAEDHKDSSAFQLIKSNVEKLKQIIGSIDKVLKTHNVDVEKMYGDAKEKAGKVKNKATKLAKFLSKKAGETSLGKKMGKLAEDVKAKLTDQNKEENPEANGPPQGDKKLGFVGSALGKLATGVTILTTTVTDLVKSRKDETEKKDPNKKAFDEANKDAEERKKEVQAEKDAVKAEDAKEAAAKKKGGWLDSILSGLLSLGGTVVGGIGGILKSGFGFLAKGMWKTVRWLGPKLLKGMGSLFRGLFSKLIPNLSGSIAKNLQGLVGKGLRGAGKLAWEGAKKILPRALPWAGRALAMVGRGALMVASGPVGWAIAAGTALYLGYKLYKYVTRNDVADDIFGKLTRYRLLAYGFNDTRKEFYSKIFDLEMAMKEHVKWDKYQVTIDKMEEEDIDKILDMFGVDKEEKDKYSILNSWFTKRFIPAFRAFMQALYTTNSNLYLDEIDKLKDGDVFNFVTKLNMPTEIYNIESIPTFDNPKTPVTKSDVDNMLTNIVNLAKSKSGESKKDQDKKIEEENKRKKAEQQKAAALKKQQEAANAKKADAANAKDAKATEQLKKTTNLAKDTGAIAKAGAKPIGQGAGSEDPSGKPKGSNTATKSQTISAGSTPQMAGGPIEPGNESLEGISLAKGITPDLIHKLNPNVKQLFTGMAAEYNRLTGKKILVTEAFRTYEHQEMLYKKYGSPRAAKPGFSTHEKGLALDINSPDADALDKLGLMKKYGFTRPIGGETWHIEPAGVSIDPKRSREDVNFANSATLASPGHGGGGLGTKGKGYKGRNIDLQQSLFDAGTSVTIAPNKDKELPKPSATTTTTPGKTDTSKPSNTKTATTPVKTVGSDTAEPKPITTGTKTTPSLDKSNTVKPADNSNLNVGSKGSGASGSIEAIIRKAAAAVGMNGDSMLTFAKLESSLNPNAGTKTSGAKGLFQFIPSTWKAMLKKYGAKFGIPMDADVYDPYYNSVMGGLYAKDNLSYVKGYEQLGMDESTALYIAHHFGSGGARSIIKAGLANPNASMADAVGPAAYKANRQEIGNKTISEYVQFTAARMAKAAGTVFKGQSSAAKAATSAASDANASVPASSSSSSVDSGGSPSSVTKTSTPASSGGSSSTSSTPTVRNTAPAPVTTTRNDTPVDTQQRNLQTSQNTDRLLSDQLSTLVLISNILKSIDGKVGGTSTPANQSKPVFDKSISKNGIDLSIRIGK